MSSLNLEEIRSRVLAGGTMTLEEERFYISSVRRGYSAALATREKTVRKAVAKGKKSAGLEQAALDNLLDSI